MGNNYSTPFIPSSRQIIHHVDDSAVQNFNRTKESQTFVNDKNLDKDVSVHKYLPKSEDGYPIYKFSILQTTDPYSIVNFSHPDNDEWCRAVFKEHINTAIKGEEIIKEFGYIYLFNQLGYSILDGETKKPVFDEHFSEVHQIASNEDYSYPRIVSSYQNSTSLYSNSYEISTQNIILKDLKILDGDMRMFRFYNQRIEKVISKESRPHFVAAFQAYIFVVNHTQTVLGHTPFVNAGFATKLTYPYAIVADLIISDSWYSYPDHMASILIFALEFTRIWLKIIWHVDTNKPFQYNYLNKFYERASVRIASKTNSLFKLDLRMIDHFNKS